MAARNIRPSPNLLILLLMMSSLVLAACGGAAPKDSQEPSDGRMTDRQRVDEEKALIESLRSRSQEPQFDEAAGAGDRSMSCEEVCNVAHQICKSRDTICEIADEHAGELRYEEDCRWATQMCNEGTASCDRCR